MNPILERFARINKNNLLPDSALEVVHEGNYIFFQTATRKKNQVPQKLFALDIDQQKLVLDMLQTEAKSPHRKIDIGIIESFYTQHEVQGDSYDDYLHAVTQGQEELEVSSRFWASTRDLEEMAIVLGAICDKSVGTRLKSGEIVPLTTAGIKA